jgi:hypothetical protein
MNKKKIIGLCINIIACLLASFLLFYDFIHGNAFSFGPIKVAALLICLFLIYCGLSLIFSKNPPRFLDICILQIEELLIKDKKAINRKNFILFAGILIFLSLMISQFFSKGIQEVLNFPDYTGAGTPITLTQVLVALLFGMICLLIAYFVRSDWQSKIIDLAICMVLLFSAGFLWSKLPLMTNFFTRAVDPNSGLYYPFSDSRIYDLGTFSLLTGYGFGFKTPMQRPLYCLFLAILHLIYDGNFYRMMLAQVKFFAIIPVFAYLLGKKFGGRTVGGMLAVLIIFREYNQILLSSQATLVSVQMMMSELFTELLLIVLVLFSFKWFSNLQSKNLALLTGMWFGLSVLNRGQIVILAAVYLLYFLILLVKKQKKILIPFLCFLISFGAVIIPWMTRNYFANGSFTIDDPGYLLNILTTYGGNSVGGGASTGVSTFSLILQRVVETGGSYLHRTISFMNFDLVNSLFQLPFSAKLVHLQDYVNKEMSGYPVPFSHLSLSQFIVLAIQTIITGLGITYAIRKFGFKGIAPLLIYGLYGLSGVLLGFAGFRFVQPVDWIILLYWCMGVLILLMAILPFKELTENPKKIEMTTAQWRLSPIVIALVIIAGMVLPLIDQVSQRTIHFPDENRFGQEVNTWSKPIGMKGIAGYAKYPIVFTQNSDWIKFANDGISPHSFYSEQVTWNNQFVSMENEKGYPILYFLLTRDNVRDVIMDAPELPTEQDTGYFFDGDEVYIYGCDQGDHIQAYYIQVKKGDQLYEIVSSLPNPDICVKVN